MLPTLSWRPLAALLVVAVLAGCGGGGGSEPSEPTSPSPLPGPAPTPTPTPTPLPVPVAEKPGTRDDAARFLTQATFGPTDADIDRLMALGYSAWIDEQLALPAASHRSHWEARDAGIKAANPAQSAGVDQVYESFWKQAVTGPDQLRQRVVKNSESGKKNRES